MEVKVNKEIRDYTESMFFGLSLRQFIFSVLACLIAACVYFGLRPFLGLETTSWICVLSAFPFAVIGFLKYNGMTCEKFLLAWFRSVFLVPKVLTFGNTNVYYQLLQEPRQRQASSFHRRGGRKKRRKVKHDQDIK